MFSNLPFHSKAMKGGTTSRQQGGRYLMLLNTIKVLRLCLPKTTADLKLSKSDFIGCAIARVPTREKVTEKKTNFICRDLNSALKKPRLVNVGDGIFSTTF